MIVGKKIKLRPFNVDDAKDICELKSDFTAMKAFGGSPYPANIESEKEWITRMYPFGVRESIYFAIEEIDNKEFIGYVVARKINYINKNADVGIILLKEARGKGFYKEISYLFYAYLFNELNLHKIYSLDILDNTVALEADKKYGFKVEGILKEHIWQEGKYKDAAFVSLLKQDFYEKFPKI